MHRTKDTKGLALVGFRLCAMGDEGLQRGKEAWGGAILFLEELLSKNILWDWSSADVFFLDG